MVDAKCAAVKRNGTTHRMRCFGVSSAKARLMRVWHSSHKSP